MELAGNPSREVRASIGQDSDQADYFMDAADVHERECAFGVRDIWSRRRSRPAGLGHGSGLRSVLNGHGKLSIM